MVGEEEVDFIVVDQQQIRQEILVDLVEVEELDLLRGLLRLVEQEVVNQEDPHQHQYHLKETMVELVFGLMQQLFLAVEEVVLVA